jgi:hypothetical protein
MTTKGKTDKSKTSKRTVEVGKVYSCKLAGSYVPVRIDKAAGKGRYQGMSMTDGKPVAVSAGDIRGDGQSCKDWHLAHQKATGDDGRKDGQAALESAAKVASKVLGMPVGVLPPKCGKRPTTIGADRPAKAVEEKRQPKADKPAKDHKPSGLDAAAQVLAEAGEPLNTKDMVARMLEVGLWKTKGKTPAATIYAAIIREIAVKGSASRFRKTERGKFELVK